MENGVRQAALTSVMFGAGILLGVGIGVLLAPHSGAYTRRQLRNLAEDVGERAGSLVDDAQDAVKSAVKGAAQYSERLVGR